MTSRIHLSTDWLISVSVGVCLLALLVSVVPVSAQINPLPEPDPKPGSYGLEATKPQPPPKTGARITTPGNGQSFANSPITVSGICPSDLLVQVYNNGVMVGAVVCTDGSFSLQVSLFAGTNELTAIVYDNLDQAGPVSNTVTVTYTNTNFTAFGELITLTSSYGRRSAPVNNQLAWPLQLSGGTGPYAFSIDWGEGSSLDLKSQSLAGLVTINHTYRSAGIYKVNVRVTDANGVSAFLQVIAVSSGQVDATTQKADTTDQTTTGSTKVMWFPAATAVALLIPTYWLGRRSQIVSLRNRMMKERDSYEEN